MGGPTTFTAQTGTLVLTGTPYAAVTADVALFNGLYLSKPSPPNLMPPGQMYNNIGQYTLSGLVAGSSYSWSAGPQEPFALNGVNGPLIRQGAFVALSQAIVFGGTPGAPVTAVLTVAQAPQPGAGVKLLQFQESLDTRRAAGRQGKSFQLEFINTQGRVKLVGQRISSVPGRDRRGIQN